MRLHIGIKSNAYHGYGFAESLAKIKEHGYDYIDYQNFVNIESDFFKLPEDEFIAEILEQKAAFSSHGLRISQAHAPWRSPKDNDPEERKRWILAMKKAIRGTHALDCRRFVVHPLMPYMDTAEHPDEVWAMNEQFLAELADYAKDYNVTVCFENMPFTVFPISTPEHCVKMVDKLGRDNLKICLDTGHAAIFEGKDVANAVRTIGHRLEALHIHDNMGENDEHLYPGYGIIDWDEFALALREVGFNKVISLETCPRDGKFPKEEWTERDRELSEIAKRIAEKAF